MDLLIAARLNRNCPLRSCCRTKRTVSDTHCWFEGLAFLFLAFFPVILRKVSFATEPITGVIVLVEIVAFILHTQTGGEAVRALKVQDMLRGCFIR